MRTYAASGSGPLAGVGACFCAPLVSVQLGHGLGVLTIMAIQNSPEMTVTVVTELLADVSAMHTEWFPLCRLNRTIKKLKERVSAEGVAFLTKTMPSLRKELDRALTGEHKLDCLRFRKIPGTELPMFMGEFFQRVFSNDGWIKPDPCVTSVRILRQVLDLFYKYQLPYDKDTEQATIELFKETDGAIGNPAVLSGSREETLETAKFCWRCVQLPTLGRVATSGYSFWYSFSGEQIFDHSRCDRERRGSGNGLLGSSTSSKPSCCVCRVISQQWARWSNGWYREIEPADASANKVVAKGLLARLLSAFDPLDIVPRHGPGAVSTGEKSWEKWQFRQYYTDSCAVYPLDAYFYANLSHVCDEMRSLDQKVELLEGTAKVVLVPKDSRGPRLISAEPCEKQWLQQGLGRALTAHVERHPLTRGMVNFTNQFINRKLALKGSLDESVATLDLKEASDRVSLELVRELFPERLYEALVATRSACTLLPDGEVIRLRKFAPMGSALCFPIMALTIWAVVTACLLRKDGYTGVRRNRYPVFVYGDDVIVETRHASDAIKALEAVGLKVNTTKSFTTGSFRESCGLDAFRGEEVQPVRIKTVWTSSRDASTYASWIAYANSFWLRGYRRTAQHIAEELSKVYGPIPTVRGVYFGFEDLNSYKDRDLFGFPHLMFDTDVSSGVPKRWNADYQRFQYLVYTIKPKKVRLSEGRINGWSELFRFLLVYTGEDRFDAGIYAERRTSKLVRRWR